MHYTRHAQKRFAERFPKLVKTTALEAIDTCFKAATPNKSTRNNTAYMVFLHERYGDFNVEFFENGPVLFICRGGLVMTVIDRNDPNSPLYKTHGASKSRFTNRKNG